MTRATVTTRLEIVENTLPSWLTSIAVGERRNVSLNTLYDTRDVNNPDTYHKLNDGTGPMLSAWCSTTYAKEFGRYGSIIVAGGGHADGATNSVHRYDIEARTWTALTKPDPIVYPSTNRSTLSDSGSDVPPPLGWPTDEIWANVERTQVLTGKVASTHTYCHVGYVPPDIAGNVNGWFVLVPFKGWPHYVDFDNLAAGWQRFTEHLFTSVSYGYVLVDRIRKRLMAVGSPDASGWGFRTGFINLLNRTVEPIPTAMKLGMAYYHAGFHDEVDDIYLTAHVSKPLASTSFQVIDPVANTCVNPTKLNPPANLPTNTAGTWEWAASENAMVHYSGLPNDASTNSLYWLEPTGDPRIDPWAWREQVFTGDAAATRDGNAMFRRLHWVEELGAFFHVARNTGPVQCWRVR